ncbi:MAG: polymerase sigma factor [Neobacillus sp.]|nr:polymerase sigma factor [Neobacillus sp.]
MMNTNKEITEWFYTYNKDIYHFLLYYVGSGDIEDLVQDVFIRAIKGFDSFQSKSTPKTWLFSIARNVGIDEVRKRKRSRIKHFIGGGDYEPKDDTTPEKVLQLNENNKNLYREIQALKSNYRDVVILRAIKELSVSETAAVLSWSESKVSTTYHRALKALGKKKEVTQYESIQRLD